MNIQNRVFSVNDEIPSLVESLHSDSPVDRERARRALIAIGRKAVVPLLHELNSVDPQTCREAVKALGAIADPAAADALTELLVHENHDVRWLAAEALVSLGREGLRQVLMALLSHADSIYLQKGAYHVLAHFAQYKSTDYLMSLLPLFHSSEPAVAIPLAALHALHELETLNSPRNRA